MVSKNTDNAERASNTREPVAVSQGETPVIRPMEIFNRAAINVKSALVRSVP